MPLTATDIGALLNYWAANEALYASAHSAWSATGGNELSGGSYARVAVTWASASGPSVSLSGTPYTVNVPASSTVGWVGFWTALTGGTFAGMFPGGNFAAYTFAAPSSTSVLLAPGSAYANGTTVVVFATSGSALPAGLTAGTVYYVVSASGDSFQLSATSGGSAITLTGDGSGIVQRIVSETFSGAGTYQVSGCTLTGT